MPNTLNSYDPARTWVYGTLVTFVLHGMLRGILEFLGMLPFLAVSLLIVRRRQAPIADVYRLKPFRLADLKFPAAFALSFGCAETLVLEAADYVTGGALDRTSELLSGEIPGDTLLVQVVVLAVVAPVLEELFFRGFFMSSMVEMGFGWAVVLPSLFFALAHNPLKWPTTFIAAAAWSIFVLETGSIAAGVAGHAVNNLLGVLLSPLCEALPGATGHTILLGLRVAGAASGLLFLEQYRTVWLSFRKHWALFRTEPGVYAGVRYLLKRWPYWVVLVMLVATLCLYGVIIVTGGPIKVN